MKKFFITLLFGLLSVFSLQAQMNNPVSWKFSVNKINETEREIVLTASIEKDWHIYSQFTPDGGPMATFITFEKSGNYKLVGKTKEFPVAHKAFDKVFGIDVFYLEKTVELKQRIIVKTGEVFQLSGTVEYQACQEGKCVMFDPAFNLKVEGNGDIKSVDKKNLDKEKQVSTEDEQEEDSSLWMFFWMAFVGGLAAVVMPCVFPMIPMTVSFFMHNDSNKAKARAKALFFSLSIVGIYTALGLLISVVLGADFVNWLSTNWVPNLVFFVIFMIFAASFFGAFEIVLPSWVVNKSESQADKGGYIGAFFMAFTLVLVSFSCTAPIVGTVLVEAARGSILRPIIGMLGFSLAIALPFGFFAFFPSKLGNLPRSGGWLNSVKVVLGFIEVALGFKFLMIVDQTYHLGILDREVYLALWIVIFFLLGLYLLGKIKFAHDSEVKHIGVFRLMLVIINFTFVVYLIPGMFGAPLKAVAGYMPPQETIDFDINKIVRDNAKEIMKSGISVSGTKSKLCEEPKYSNFLHLAQGLDGYFDFNQAVKCAKAQNKPIFIDFTGHGCVNCREMEQTVWSDPRVLKMLKNEYVVVALYVDDKTTLPESEWIVSDIDGRVKKTLGKKNAYFQINNFDTNAQPNYILLDGNADKTNLKSGILAPARGHNLNTDAFVEFLKKGLEEFHNRNK
ncbi:MAG: cytochrome c biogenesis protein CcdA [Marinifilaceae bacterium]